jgi:type III restriction enzyme
VRAINELKPLLGLELTATPFVETTKGPVPFKNVVMDYPLARAMEDGFRQRACGGDPAQL